MARDKEAGQFIYSKIKTGIEDIFNLAPYADRPQLIDAMLGAKTEMFRQAGISEEDMAVFGSIAMIDVEHMDAVILGELDGQEISTN